MRDNNAPQTIKDMISNTERAARTRAVIDAGVNITIQKFKDEFLIEKMLIDAGFVFNQESGQIIKL
jgi:hypothetical protein